MTSRRLAVIGSVAVAAGLVAGLAGPASARQGTADDAEQALAERFAPVVALVRQDVDCGPGEPYQPSDVGLVLGNPSVALRGPWDEVIKPGPTAEDLSNGLYGYYLDYPGNPLEAGCDYEQWAGADVADSPPTTYAHVATEAGREDRIALQYWFFYPYNDYTNKHEGDWEMVQLVFAAGDATGALDQTPVEVGFSQHEGLEVSTWDDPKASRSSTAPTSSCTPRPARTPTSTRMRSSSVRRPSRASVATTPATPPTRCARPSPSSPAIPRRLGRRTPG